MHAVAIPLKRMITLLLVIAPIFFALELFLVKDDKVKYNALVLSILVFVVSLIPAFQFQKSPDAQFVVNFPWIASMGISFKLGMDGISYLLVLLTTFLTPLIILSSFKHEYKNPKAFYALILFMEAGLLGVFTSMDAFLFYIFWELALIPVYFISAIWGGQNRIKVIFKFFLYTIVGSLFMLLGIIYLYFQTPGAHSFDINAFYQLRNVLNPDTQSWLFWCFFIAFAIKMPIFPFHTWQPDTYTESPTPATMLLAGIMLKMGIYGVIRWMLPIFPEGLAMWGNTALILSIIGIVYASVLAIIQKDVKRLIAYSSIAHVGLISAGLFTLNSQGLEGAVIQMLSHGINVVGLFFVAEIIFSQTGTRQIDELGGITNKAPQLAVLFMIVMMASVALPLTNGFIGEFMLLMGIYKVGVWYAVFAGLTIILGAVYMLNTYKNVMFGPESPLVVKFKDVSSQEKAVLIPIVIMIFWIGLYPKTFTNIAQPAVEQLVQIINNK